MTTLLCSSVYNKVVFFKSLPLRSAFLPPVRKPTSAVTKSRLSLARRFDQSRYSRYVTRAACRVREADQTCVPGLTSHVPFFLVRPDRQRQGQERSTRLRQAGPIAGGGSHEPSLIKPKHPHAIVPDKTLEYKSKGMQGNEGHAINLSLFQDHIPIGVPVLGLQGSHGYLRQMRTQLTCR